MNTLSLIPGNLGFMMSSFTLFFIWVDEVLHPLQFSAVKSGYKLPPNVAIVTLQVLDHFVYAFKYLTL